MFTNFDTYFSNFEKGGGGTPCFWNFGIQTILLLCQQLQPSYAVIDRNRNLNRNRNTEILVWSEPIPKPKPKDRAYRNRNRNF
jgi:hypothetical protein